MSAMGERSMMWRTTYGFGAFGFGLLLAYVGFVVGTDAQYGIVFRIFAASPLLFGAVVCAITAVRELRGDKSNRPRKPTWNPKSRARLSRHSPAILHRHVASSRDARV